MKLLNGLKGYKGVALLEIAVCVLFFINVGAGQYGKLFDIVNSVGAGILFFGSLMAYFKPRKWTLWMTTYTMLLLIVFNTATFFVRGTFFSTGFPLIAYDTLFIIANLHFCGKGLN
ncbi:MAG: hypothetical protein LBS74_11325 [Oscillospiraceae bacterium]|nr:hypothetical protein [Oscillospiraceae bacterium]